MSTKVYVWDKFVRLFHWSLLVLFVASYLTGEEEHWLHSYSGYGIFVLVSLRIIWGLIGSPYARFKAFVYSPVTVFLYLNSIATGSPRRYIGHNPAGGAMVIALMTVLLVTTLSGMKLYAIEEGKGPFANDQSLTLVTEAYADDDYESSYEAGESSENEEFWEEVHEFSINAMFLLIVLHLLGVAVASRQHHESLVRSMINGYKERR